MEGRHEIAGLRFWDGNPTVRLIEADERIGAMLLERCEPGTVLRALQETEQDRVIAGLLRRMWRTPLEPYPFRPLSEMLTNWAAETLGDAEQWTDSALVQQGLRLFEELSRSALYETVLATDLHAGNVLAERRERWLVIDPKPFFGDIAYHATQHLFNCAARLRSDPDGTVRQFSDLLGVDYERVRLWTFARAAAEPRDDWGNDAWLPLARAIAP
jgi:streptomycin 6-kinase